MSELFTLFVKQPLLNLLQIFYNLTGDTGWAIVIVGVLINLAIWPLFVKSYVNSQKLRLLQPELKKIQTKHKSNPQELLAKTREFYTKHNIKNGTTFLVLIIQIILLSGLFFSVKAITEESTNVPDLYSFVGEGKPQLDHVAFGFMDTTEKGSEYIWMPFITALFTYLQGMYMFRWGPKPKLLSKKEKKKKANEPPSMAESFQKSMEVQSIYVLPFLFFFINTSFLVALNIYFLTSTSISLIRQIILSNYYTKNTDKLLEGITESDPTSKDDNPDNNLENTADPSQLASQEVATSIQKKNNNKPKNKKNTKKKKQTSKKKKK